MGEKYVFFFNAQEEASMCPWQGLLFGECLLAVLLRYLESRVDIETSQRAQNVVFGMQYEL